MKKLTVALLGIMTALGLSSCMGASQDGTAQQSSTGGMIGMIAIYAVILIGMYLLFIRPSSKKKKEEEALRQSLEIGDEIITIGGITGRVVSIKDDDSFILETGPDRTRMLFQKWALSTIVTEKTVVDPKADKKKDKEKDKKKVEEK